jgi:hypothetical protein
MRHASLFLAGLFLMPGAGLAVATPASAADNSTAVVSSSVAGEQQQWRCYRWYHDNNNWGRSDQWGCRHRHHHWWHDRWDGDRSRGDRSHDDQSYNDRTHDDQSYNDRTRGGRSHDDQSYNDRTRGDRSQDNQSSNDTSDDSALQDSTSYDQG